MLEIVSEYTLVDGDVDAAAGKTLIVHPASTTHFIVSPEDRVLSGVTQDLIRVRSSNQ
jgi:O-acetylhomoserine/O-acetylserine sulfhydrylase-like pyridoxal-dependent enzyme